MNDFALIAGDRLSSVIDRTTTTLAERAPDNDAPVPISFGQERRKKGLVWAAYLHVRSSRWGDVETSSTDAKDPAIALKEALRRMLGELTPRYKEG